jgi:ubiquinone/menaquinone biosynthesis C-methylase UbiE
MGYEAGAVRRLHRFTAETDAAYLLTHLKAGMRLLDIGCGPGNISVGLASAVDPGEVYGIDISETQVELSTEAARDAGHSNARFQVADALNLPFPGNHFDAVHCHAVLMHIPDAMAALAEIKRVLRSGGILGASDLINESAFIEPDFGNLKGAIAMFAAGLTANGGHPQIGKELGAKFSEGGFAGIESTGVLETWGTSPGAAEFTDFWLSGAFGPTFGDKAVARGIATQEKIDE